MTSIRRTVSHSSFALFRTFLAAFWLIAAASLVPGAGTPRTALAAEAPLSIWRSGEVEVFALLDMQGGMDAGLFSGPASAKERSAYFPGGKAPASFNAFLIKGGRKSVLVDSGLGELSLGKSALIAQLAAAGVTPDQVDNVLLTHMHSDHIGGLVANGRRVFPNARIAVSGPEYEYWMGVADNGPGSDNASLVKTVIKAYGTDIVPPFALGSELMPGMRALDASGHTPGHTVFQLSVGGKTLLILGDLLHAASLQFPLPDECASYDLDKAKAVEARKRILDLAAEKGWPVAGMHLPFPGTGSVSKEGKGYKFTPLQQ